MTEPSLITPKWAHRVEIVSGSYGGCEKELSKLRQLAGYDPGSRTWKTSLTTPLADSDIEKLEALFRIATGHGASVFIRPIVKDEPPQTGQSLLE